LLLVASCNVKTPAMDLSFEKIVDRVTHYASASERGVICGESEDNPHGVNHESRCSRAAWLARDAEGLLCRRIIRDTFGDDVVARIDAALERDTN